MQTTTNYGLRKPEGTDVADIDDLNYNADIIDEELSKKLDGEGTVTDYDEAIAMTEIGKVPDCTIIKTMHENFLAGCSAIAAAITGGRDGNGTGGIATAATDTPTEMSENITDMAILNYNDGLNAATGTTPSVSHVWNPASPSAGAAAALQAKVTSDGYVSTGTVLASTDASTSPSVAVTGGTGEETVNVVPGVYNKIKINRTAAYNAGANSSKVGTATADDVLNGATFTNASSVGVPGGMPNRGAVSYTFTPGISEQTYTVQKGYHNGSGVIKCAAVSAKKVLASNNTGSNVDMGGAFRYVNAEAVYAAGIASVKVARKLTLTASQTGSNVDIADNWYTTCDASAVYDKGKSDGIATMTGGVQILTQGSGGNRLTILDNYNVGTHNMILVALGNAVYGTQISSSVTLNGGSAVGTYAQGPNLSSVVIWVFKNVTNGKLTIKQTGEHDNAYIVMAIG